MNVPLLLLALAVLGVAGAAILYLRLQAAVAVSDAELAGIERAELMTPAEAEFITVLDAAMPGYRIFAQVSMNALLTTRPGLERRRQFALRNRFNRQRIDYLVATPGGRGLVVVELDDRSHDGPAAKVADARRDALLLAADYPTVRISNRPWPTPAQVRAAILPAIGTVDG